MIKFIDLHHQYLSIKNEIDDAINNIISESAYINSKQVHQFENCFADYHQSKYCVGVGNGTDALEIAINALNLPKGKEIIVPANSFISSAESVSNSGFKVVFCDANPDDYTINIEDVKKRITPNTVAIMAVHLYGHPCNMDLLTKLAKTYDLKIIEDCAQAHGTEYKGKKIGAIGDIGCFSFYPSKNLGGFGDGGAITTNNEEIAIKCRMIANHGRVSKYNHEFEGRNSRLDGLQAAILSVKLKHLDDWIYSRINLAKYYLENFKNVNQLILPKKENWAKQVYHLFVVRTKKRDALMKYLSNNNIETGIHYPIALPKLRAYKYLNQGKENLFANRIDKTLLSLPIGEHLTKKDLNNVIHRVKKFFK